MSPARTSPSISSVMRGREIRMLSVTIRYQIIWATLKPATVSRPIAS